MSQGIKPDWTPFHEGPQVVAETGSKCGPDDGAEAFIAALCSGVVRVRAHVNGASQYARIETLLSDTRQRWNIDLPNNRVILAAWMARPEFGLIANPPFFGNSIRLGATVKWDCRDVEFDKIGLVAYVAENLVPTGPRSDDLTEALAATPLRDHAAAVSSPRRRGRKPGSGKFDDIPALQEMVRLLAHGTPSRWAATAKVVEMKGMVTFHGAKDNARRRLNRKFFALFGNAPPAGKTWADVEFELNSNPALK